MAANRAFLVQKWQKRHRYTVEACIAINAADYATRRMGDSVIVGSVRVCLPDVTIEKLRSGATWRSYLVCPRCERLCGYLFLPPPERHCESAPEWACRACHCLVYASQRYGRRHPLRAMGPPRGRAKRTTEQRLPSWYDESRMLERARRGKFDLPALRFEHNAYGIPIRRVA